MRTMYILRTDDRPTTDRPTSPFGKLRTAISATGHPIHFMFGSRLAAILENFENFHDDISGMNYPIHFHELHYRAALEEYRRK